MHIRLLASAVALALGIPAFAAADTPPTTPTNLAARAYDKTSGGIRWDRSSDDRGTVRGYEITRNGAVIGVRDTLSYIDRALVAGTTYTFGVTAIDSAGQRSGTAVTRLTTPGGATTPTTPAASGLAAPSALRADVYSTSNAELFWARSATSGLRYEVRLDGRVVTTTDGISYYAASLSSGRTYAFEVIAIDRQGRRSAASTVTVSTAGGRTTITGTSGGGALDPGNPTTPTTPTPTLAAVGGLRSSVYSPTAAGIAWTRSAAPVVRYEVSRDGAVVSTTDGTSYIDSSLAGGRSYTYSVVALDARGNRSAPASTMLDTPAAGGGGGTPSIPPVVIVPTPPETPTGPIKPPSGPAVPAELPARVESRLQTVFDIANFDQLERVGALAVALEGVEEGEVPGFVQKRFATNDVGTENTTLSCPGGGQIDVVVLGGQPEPFPYYVAKDCRSGSLTFDGRLAGGTRPPLDLGGNPYFLASAQEVTLRDARDGSVATIESAANSGGSGSDPNPLVAPLGYETLRAVDFGPSPAAITLSGGARPFALTAADNTTDTRAVPPGQEFVEGGFFTTSFEARLGVDTGVTRVSTPEAFTDLDRAGNFASGRLEIVGSGFRYVVDAASGSNESFRLDVTENGSTTSYSVLWSATLRFDPFEPGKVDLGF